jgi:hypothetical protein
MASDYGRGNGAAVGVTSDWPTTMGVIAQLPRFQASVLVVQYNTLVRLASHLVVQYRTVLATLYALEMIFAQPPQPHKSAEQNMTAIESL